MTTCDDGKCVATIVICTFNRACSLKQTLQAIEACDVPSSGVVELLLVDNKSTDNTREVFDSHRSEKFRLAYVFEPVRGLSNARNAGLRSANGEIILFTDDDVCPAPDWLLNMLGPYSNPNVSAVQGRIVLDFGGPAPHWLQGRHRTFLAESGFGPSPIPEAAGFIGANMSFRRSVAADVGPFSGLLGAGRVGFGEEDDYSVRLQKKGYKIYYEPSACVRHMIAVSRLNPEYFESTAFRMGLSLSLRLGMDGEPAATFNVLTLLRATLGELRRRVRFGIFKTGFNCTPEHLVFIVYMGFAWGNFLGVDRLKRRYE